MSKINYLLIVLILLGIGYIITSQLRLATQSASQLIAAEVAKKVEIHITKAYELLKRFPNSDDEFERMVLHRLDFSRYPQRIVIQDFKPGSRTTPAFFRVIIKEKTTAPRIILSLEYYGCEYHDNPLYKGKLLRK